MANLTFPLALGGGGTGVTSATAAEVAALALAGTLTPGGLYFDAATGITYSATSASTYAPFSANPHLGTITFATMIAEPAPLPGMTARVPFLDRTIMYEYGYGADAGSGPALGWWPQGGEQVLYNARNYAFGVVTATQRQIFSIPMPMESMVDGTYLAIEAALRKTLGTSENMVVHMQLSSLPTTYDAAKDFMTVILNTTGIANTTQAKFGAQSDTAFVRWGGGVISAPDSMVKGSTTTTLTALTTPSLRTTDMYLNGWAISTAAVESLTIDQMRVVIGA